MLASMLARYKAWVVAHPGLVQNLDWLLYLGVWSPGRLSSSEAAYEAYHAAVGLLSVWHCHILDEAGAGEQGQGQPRPAHGLYLDLLEQVETLVELRAVHLERLGKMSRYSPLLMLESAKALLKFLMWSRYREHLYLRNPGPEDVDQFESEKGLQDILGALARLRARYTSVAGCTGDVAQDTVQATETAVSWVSAQLRTATGAAACASGSGGEAGGSGSSGGMRDGGGAASDLQHMGRNLLFLGETLHILRPVIYVAMLRRHGRTSWRPWLASLGVDLLSMYFQQRGKSHELQAAAMLPTGRSPSLSTKSTAGRGDGVGAPQQVLPLPRPTSLLSVALLRSLGKPAWSPGEVREIGERRRRLLLYLLRPPCVDAALRRPLQRLARRNEQVPLLGPLLDYSNGLLATFTEYYTYTSGSR